MYKVIAQDGRAKSSSFDTVHGTIQTPVFMNVGTVAAIKGAVSTMDLQEIGTQVPVFEYEYKKLSLKIIYLHKAYILQKNY